MPICRNQDQGEVEVGKQSRLGHRQEAKWKSTDSVYLPGFWGRQTRKIWARQREDGVMCQKWGGVPAKLFTIHLAQRAAKGTSEMPALLRH